ncbi:hypothetical protein CALCODRAFT_501153 [Calocera cornea HHB12733]|uniref:Polymerase III polypeptide H n=1 Tax=Calocera cornea HHB12733 TaxID=1353952 RepID=A0A165DRS7_9BASI|nr:hypothetical protein CALCODRAFT_501153 [Calocera cornea HHB12733]
MFILARLKDTVPLHPQDFALDPIAALTREINKKYANKVLHDVGLCVVLFDVVECSEGKVRFGDGCLWHKLTFRMVVFRPFVGEVFVGEVKSSTPTHVQVTLGFFSSLHIPAHLLPTPSAYDPAEKTFFWAPTLAEGQDPFDVPKEERFTIDVGAKIRCCVHGDAFWEEEPWKGPVGKKAASALPGTPGAAAEEQEQEQEQEDERRSPYTITCSAAGSGLGLVEWWVETVVEGGEGMEVEEEA